MIIGEIPGEKLVECGVNRCKGAVYKKCTRCKKNAETQRLHCNRRAATSCKEYTAEQVII